MSAAARPKRIRAIGAASALAAALPGTALFLYFSGFLTLDTWIRLAIYGGLPIALLHAGLAGPPLARLIIGRAPLDWGGALLTGMLTGALPSAMLVIVKTPLLLYAGEPIELDGWIIGVAALALSGCVGGLVFRALHGGGPIQEPAR